MLAIPISLYVTTEPLERFCPALLRLLALQYAAQVGPLQDAGLSTVAFDYLGCGRSEKPNQYSAYAASELYADLQTVFSRYTEVRT